MRQTLLLKGLNPSENSIHRACLVIHFFPII